MTFDKTVQRYSDAFCSWLASHDAKLISKLRVYPTAVIAAQLFQDEQLNAIKAFGYTTLWLFGIDRWFDERSYEIDELIGKCDRVFLAFNKKDFNLCLDSEERELVKMLIDIDKFLGDVNPRFFILRDRWIHSLFDTIFLGMLPTYCKQLSASNYLIHGRESIGVKFVNWSTFIALNREISSSEYLEFLRSQNLSAEIIRLANDCVTFVKEKDEGVINAVCLLNQDQQKSLSMINSIISAKQAKLLRLYNQRQSMPYFEYIVNLVKCTLHFYEESNFYDEEILLKKRFNKYKT